MKTLVSSLASAMHGHILTQCCHHPMLHCRIYRTVLPRRAGMPTFQSFHVLDDSSRNILAQCALREYLIFDANGTSTNFITCESFTFMVLGRNAVQEYYHVHHNCTAAISDTCYG